MKEATWIGCQQQHCFCHECLNQYYQIEGNNGRNRNFGGNRACPTCRESNLNRSKMVRMPFDLQIE